MADYSTQTPLQIDTTLTARMNTARESVWFRIGVLQSTMNDRDRALDAFERVLAVNPSNVRAMTQAGAVLAKKECYPQAVSYLQRAISADNSCGEAWAVLAHCYVMTDDLQKAYQAYQNALSHLPNPRDPNLWYGIGLLYDRYGSLDHALEAFLLVLSIAPDFERADEVCFCIGIIYKEQQNFDEALKFFNKVVVAANPPPPLTRADGWYQIGHVSELKRDIPAAFEMYRQALNENPKHPKTLQNLGWLEHQHNNNSSEAIRFLKLSADFDSTDGQTWYLLGRVYMALREFRQAYDAYQQAVYRDGRNATFWCSIGVLYYQMNQYGDAMDAYSRAIKLNPYVSEVWYDLGTLYESCGQTEDAIEAYRRAAELAPDNSQITARLAVLENSMSPTAIQQQQQQQQGQHQHPQQPSASQPGQPGAPQSIAQAQPQQMHPDMPHNQPHVISQLNPIAAGPRSLDQPLQFSQQMPAQKPIHSPASGPTQLPHHHHIASQPLSSTQSRQQQPGSPTGNPSALGSAPLEIAPLSSLRQTSISEGANPNPNSSFHQREGRPSLPPGPLPSLPLPQPNNNQSPTHLSPIASQPLPSPSTGVPNNQGPSGRDNMNAVPQQSPHSLPTHIQGTHPTMSHDGTIRQHTRGPMKDQQRSSVHQLAEEGQLSPKAQQRPIQGPQKCQSLNDQDDIQAQSQRSSGYDQTPENRNQPQHSQQGRPSISSPGQRSHHSLPNQSANSLPQLRTLPQIQDLPDGQSDKPDRHRPGINNTSEDRDRNSSRNDNGTGPQYNHNEPSRRNVYDAQDQRESSLLKMSRPDANGGHQAESSARDGFSGSHNGHVLGQSSQRERIPSIRDTVDDANNAGPGASRQTVLHDISHSESRDESRRLNAGRDREDAERKDQDSRDTQQPNGRPEGVKSDRLPGLSSLSASMDMNSARNGLPDGDRSNGLSHVSTPTLALPSSGALPSISINDNGKLATSPSRRTSSPGATTGMGMAGASLPPLSGRNPSSLSRMGPDGKDLNVSGAMSPRLGLVSSSLTKFGSKGLGRAPATPNVSTTGLPSSLPSPLPTRKGTTGTTLGHSGRSPRISKPAVAPNFKPLSVPVSGSNYGQRDTVPSPGSLPVLPALSPHRNYGEDEENKEKCNVQEKDREPDTRMQVRSSLDEKVEKETGDDGGHGRVADDVLDNKPVFGVLRPEPSSGNEKDAERSENEEKVKSPSSSGRGNPDGGLASKRENISKDDLGRTPKRPRLHDVNEKELKFDNRDDGDKGKEGSQRKDEFNGKGNNGLSKPEMNISFHDAKQERRSSGGSPDENVSKHHRRDSGVRGGESDLGKTSLPTQMIDLPRLSNQSMPKLSGPLLSGNTPLPSFRSERKILTATRSGGPGSLGKSINGEGASRGSLSFALRSASVSSIGPIKSLSAGASGRSNGDHDEYDNSPRMGETSSKRAGDDKTDSSLGRSSGRDKE